MKSMGKSPRIPESRSSKQIATNDAAAANAEEVEEQIEEDNVEKAARENRTGVPGRIMRSDIEMETADDAVASSEEVEEQTEESRVDKVALEDGISTPSTEEHTRRERVHD